MAELFIRLLASCLAVATGLLGTVFLFSTTFDEPLKTGYPAPWWAGATCFVVTAGLMILAWKIYKPDPLLARR